MVIRRLARKKTINLVHILDSVVSKSHRASDVPLISQMAGIQGFSAYAGRATYAKRVQSQEAFFNCCICKKKEMLASRFQALFIYLFFTWCMCAIFTPISIRDLVCKNTSFLFGLFKRSPELIPDAVNGGHSYKRVSPQLVWFLAFKAAHFMAQKPCSAS